MLLVPVTARAQSLAYGVRAGVVVSTTLAEDQVANPRLAAALGGGLGAVRAVPRPAFQIEVNGALPMRARTWLDLAVGWTMAGINAEDDGGTRDLQDVGVGQATVSVRYRATSILDAACGIGVIRYFAEDQALFASGTELSPLVECASRLLPMGRNGQRFFLRVAGQLHRFRTPVLTDAGAKAGSVFRLAIQVGLEVGGRR